MQEVGSAEVKERFTDRQRLMRLEERKHREAPRQRLGALAAIVA